MYNAAPPYAAGQQSQSQSPYGNAGPAGLPGGGMMHGNGNGNGMPQMVPGMNGMSTTCVVLHVACLRFAVLYTNLSAACACLCLLVLGFIVLEAGSPAAH